MGMCSSLMNPQAIFKVIAVLCLALGVLSAFLPGKSIALYQGIMEKFNWRVAPIDEAKEVRNTRLLGTVLAVISLVLLLKASCRC